MRSGSPTRRATLQTIGGALAVGLAGCNSDGSDATATPPETTTGGPAPPTQTATPTATESRQKYVLNPRAVHSELVEATDPPEEGVRIGFRLEDSTLPFTTEVYHAAPDATVHATETYESQDLADVPLVPDPPDALDTLATDREDVHYATTPVGEPLKVTLVARHDGDTFTWSAHGRTGHPYDGHAYEDPALSVDCYCGGEVYTAPDGGTWARVIQVTPKAQVDPGTTVVLNWHSGRV